MENLRTLATDSRRKSDEYLFHSFLLYLERNPFSRIAAFPTSEEAKAATKDANRCVIDVLWREAVASEQFQKEAIYVRPRHWPVGIEELIQGVIAGLPRQDTSASPNHLVRAYQYRLRDRKSEGLCRLQIDDQFKLGGLLDGQLGRLGTPENPVH